MNFYAIALFLHVTGALGLFAALGIEWTSLRHLRSAVSAEKALEWARVVASLRWLYPASMLTILASGMYMMSAWGMVGWIMVGFASMVLLGVIGGALSGRRMRAIAQGAAAESGPLSPALRPRVRDRILQISIQVRLAVALGIIFLMTVKPGFAGSLLVIGVALVAGLASTIIPERSRDRVRAQVA